MNGYIIFSMIISFSSANEEIWKGYLYALGIFLSTAISTCAMENARNYFFILGMQMKTAVTSVIYKKVGLS